MKVAGKVNVTARHILDRAKPGTGVERLFFHLPQGQLPINYDWLEAVVAERTSEGTFFLPDTNFCTRHEVPERVWVSLMRRRVVISPFVWHELQPWLEKPFYNAEMAKLVRDSKGAKNSPILLDGEFPWDQPHLVARKYYVTLLSARKQRGRKLVNDFLAKTGRSPTSEELNRLFQIGGNDRDFHLLRKGSQDLGKENFFADEDLVTTAAMIALFGGCDTIILTRDRDVVDQFTKLADLLTWHYQAMLFAEQFAADVGSFVTVPMPRGIAEVDLFFEAEHSLLVKKKVENPDDFVGRLLPAEFQPVLLGCLLFGGEQANLTVTPFIFNAEFDVGRLMCVKGETKGLNTNKLDGRNCHVTGFPVEIKNPRNWVVVSRDKMYPITRSGEDGILLECVPSIDYGHAVFHFDRPVLTGTSWWR